MNGKNTSPLFLQIAVLGALVLAAALFAIPALAQEPTFDEVNQVARKLNCPTCQSLNLADCRTQTCSQWRDQIKDMLASGMGEQEILDWYAAQYGDEVLQEPPRRGVSLYVWVLPGVALLGGVIWLGYSLKKWSAKRAIPIPVVCGAAPPADAPDDYLSRVEQDLKNL